MLARQCTGSAAPDLGLKYSKHPALHSNFIQRKHHWFSIFLKQYVSGPNKHEDPDPETKKTRYLLNWTTCVCRLKKNKSRTQIWVRIRRAKDFGIRNRRKQLEETGSRTPRCHNKYQIFATDVSYSILIKEGGKEYSCESKVNKEQDQSIQGSRKKSIFLVARPLRPFYFFTRLTSI